MTLKILAVILSLISMAVALSSPSTPSDAYQVGYVEGRFDLYTESKAIKKSMNASLKKRRHPKPAGRIRSNGQRFLSELGCNYRPTKG